MGFPTKVQLIKRQNSGQWYINFPSAIAQAMEFTRGETVEWIIEDRTQLVLRRLAPPASAIKKNGCRRQVHEPLQPCGRGLRGTPGDGAVADRPLRAIVIAPLAYRPAKGAKLLYRQPERQVRAEPDAPVEKVLQAYIRRWGIEVNFRDQKRIIGVVGAPRSRDETSARAIPQTLTAVYKPRPS